MAVTPHDTELGHGTDAAATQAAAHGGEHAATFPPFDATTFASQLFWFALSFIALWFVLAKFVLPKIGHVLHTRATTISTDLDQAATKSAEAEGARSDMEKATAKARADARAMVDAARAEVQAKLTAEQEAAEARLGERIREAEARVNAARQKALAEVPALASTLAREIADKIAPASATRGGGSPNAAPRSMAQGEA